ncbi:hypothetical protein SLOPH_2285 [Spraguea lophii 42_110]|uniref:Uncharacterized protein n=1 Tax=Spraguea lophii (strain 42_110) TaxID=1358809 RepID=S7XGB5_SPRLO|nr:hypothetical protein SLOPH_2285 [Spraguea lophii 42_110]
MIEKIIRLEYRNYEEIVRIINDTQEDIHTILVDLIIYYPAKIVLVNNLLKEIKEDIKYKVFSEVTIRFLNLIKNDGYQYNSKNSRVNDFISIIRALYVFSLRLFNVKVQLKNKELNYIIKNCERINKELNTQMEELEECSEFIQIINKDEKIDNEINTINAALMDMDIKFIEELCKTIELSVKYSTNGDVFIGKQTIDNFGFDRNECVNQLIKYYDVQNYNYLCKGIFLAEEQNRGDFFYVALVIVLAKSEGFLKVLYSMLDETNNSFKNKLLAFIFEQYYSPAFNIKLEYVSELYNPETHEEEIKIFRTIVDDSTIKEMEKYSSIDALNQFFNLNLEETIIPGDGCIDIRDKDVKELMDMDKIMFFTSFCFYCSDSITHFLTYLELYRKCFILNDDEQRIFLEVFRKFFINRKSFRKFVLQKILKFKMIKKEIAMEYNDLFLGY